MLVALISMGEVWKGKRKKPNITMSLERTVGMQGQGTNLGIVEDESGKKKRAVNHFMIAAETGYDDSLKEIRECFLNGHATKEDFERALRYHKDSNDEMESKQRKAAAEFYDRNR